MAKKLQVATGANLPFGGAPTFVDIAGAVFDEVLIKPGFVVGYTEIGGPDPDDRYHHINTTPIYGSALQLRVFAVVAVGETFNPLLGEGTRQAEVSCLVTASPAQYQIHTWPNVDDVDFSTPGLVQIRIASQLLVYDRHMVGSLTSYPMP